jgi:hypothetical protein
MFFPASCNFLAASVVYFPVVNRFNVNRTQVLAVTTVVLFLFAVVYHLWAGWGLVTIHANKEPLGKVIASMERQGHAKVQTDLPLDTPVTMDCVKAPLTDALETLSVVTESRWRLLYFVAGDKTTLKNAEIAWFAGQRPDGWKMIAFPTGNMLALTDDAEDEVPPDPRLDVWTPKTASPAALQDFLTDAAALTNAGFAYPVDWNPAINSAPKPDIVEKAVPKLISAAGGREDGIFFLSKTGRGGPRGAGSGGGPTMGGGMDPNLMAEHVQAEIDRLPPDERAQAQSNYNTERAFWASLKDMTDEQRLAAVQQHMQDPQVQQMMADRMDARDGRMNHQQRLQHFANYVNRKIAATGRP